MKFYAPIKLSENIRETTEGFLLCLDVPITRTGELIYAKGETPIPADDEGKVIVTRDEEEVFNPKTMASFEGKAITITHPVDFVTPTNWKELSKGSIQNVRRGEGVDKDNLLADLLIMDAVAIGLVKKGLREVSCGYEAEYIQTAKGRGKQKNILGNHLALVDKGRAGETCAINDHDGKGLIMSAKLKEKFTKLFAKTLDEAMLDEEVNKEKEDKSKDASGTPEKNASGATTFDDIMKMVKDLGEKIDGMKPKSNDEKEMPKKEDKKEDEAKDEDEESATLESRLSALEKAMSKLLDGESEDEDMEEESMDADEDEKESMTSDSIARAEILSPGIKATKNVKTVALKNAYKTKEGKKVIDQLTGGKAPAFDSAERVESLFIAASELLKVKRSGDLSKTKQVRDSQLTLEVNASKGLSAEELNERNAKYYSNKK